MAEPAAVGCEGILRSVSSTLEPDTPFSRSLELAAGASASERLKSMGDLPVGAAVITPRDGRTRVISVRRARPEEVDIYESA